jgi:RimJ/RimL family protein N-acetyltransferase
VKDTAERIVDSSIRLIPYYRNDEVSLEWYQDRDLVKMVDNRDTPYDIPLLHRMYDYLSDNGDCYYIEYDGVLVGDVTLLSSGEIAIVVSKEYQRNHIGRRCVREMLSLAKEKGIKEVKAVIYTFNIPSQRMFLSLGFEKTGDEEYTYSL